MKLTFVLFCFLENYDFILCRQVAHAPIFVLSFLLQCFELQSLSTQVDKLCLPERFDLKDVLTQRQVPYD